MIMPMPDEMGMGFGLSDPLNPVSLEPSEAQTSIGAGLPSVFGSANAQQRAGAAQQFINAQLQNLPAATALQQRRLQDQLELAPVQQEKRKAQLAQEYSELKGKPVGQFVDEAAEWYGQHRDDTDFAGKAKSYNLMVEGWKQRHPGLQFPPELSNYGPDTEKHVKDAYDMKRHSIEFEQKVEIETAKEKAMVQAWRERGVSAAEINAMKSKWELEFKRKYGITTGKLPSSDQEITRLKGIVGDPKAAPEDKARASSQLELMVGPKIEADYAKKFGKESEQAIVDRLDPAGKAKRQQDRSKYMGDLRESHGLPREKQPEGSSQGKAVAGTERVRVTKDGKTFVTVPRAQLQDAKNAGYKEAPK